MNLTVKDAVSEVAVNCPDKGSQTIGGPLASLALLDAIKFPST